MAVAGDFRTVICIFCYKSERLNVKENDEPEGQQQLLSTFLTQLGRYVGTEFPKQELLDNVSTGIFEACSACGRLLKLFCQLYCEMVCVKMQLDWRLEMIVSRMGRAGKIPARIQQLKKVFSSLNFHGDEKGCRILENVKILRANVIKRCNRKLTESKPKVLLEPVSHFEGNVDLRENHMEDSLYSEVEGYNDFLLADDDGFEDITEHSEEEKYCPPINDDDIVNDNDSTKKTSRQGTESPQFTETLQEIGVKENKTTRRSTRVQNQSYQENSDSEEEEMKTKCAATNFDKGYHICVFCSKQIPRKYKSNVIKHLRNAHSFSLEEAKHIFYTKMNQETVETDEKATPCLPVVKQVQEDSDWEEEQSPNTVDKGYHICIFCSKQIPRKYKSNVIKHLRSSHSLSLEEAKSIFYTKMLQESKTDEQEEIPVAQIEQKKDKVLDENAQKPLKCSQCSTRFSYQITLDKHFKKYHTTGNCDPTKLQSLDASNKPFACKECPGRFRFQGLLFYHVKKNHTLTEISVAPRRKRLFTCRHCKMTFTFKHNLKRHIKSRHSGLRKDKWTHHEMPVKIEVETEDDCGDIQPNFVTNETQEELEEEQENLDGYENFEKPFKCDHCFTKFTYEITLQRHLNKYHSYRGPVTIPPDMDEGCADSSYGEKIKAFSCSHCSSSFTYEKNLDYHVRRYHPSDNEKGESPAIKLKRTFCSCPYCRRVFSFKSNLSRHIKRRHRNRIQRRGLNEKISGKKDGILLEDLKTSDKTDDQPTTLNADDKHSSAEVPKANAADRFKYACSLCPKRFTLRQNRYRHFKLKHSKSTTVSKNPSDDNTAKDKPKPVKTLIRDVNNEYKFTCAFCPKNISLKSNVIKHMRFMHKKSLEDAKHIFSTQVKRVKNPLFVNKIYDDDQKPFQCSHCPIGFSSSIAMRRHMKKFHNQEIGRTKTKISCPLSNCPETFDTEDDLEAHKQLHGSFKCSVCTVVKEYAPQLAIHEQEEHTLLSSAPVLAEEGEGEPHLSRGPETSSEQFTYKCLRCEYSSQSRSNYISHHVETHLGLTMKVLSCDICRAHFQNKSYLDTTHFPTHHATFGVDPSLIKRCDQCPAYFLTPTQLYYHKVNMHGVYERRTCPECGKYFAHQTNLKLHRKLEHKFDDENPDLPIPCDVAYCKKRFATMEDLEWHKCFVRHDGNREPGNEGMRSHVKTHCSEFICEQCGQRCQSKPLLQRHYLRHMDPEEYEYMCQACGRKFPTNHNLTRHMKTHSGDKPWKCQFCERAFLENHKLKYHLKHVHKYT